MATITGSAAGETLGFGNPLASKNATVFNDNLFARGGNDTLVYDVASAGGNDVYFGENGVDTLQLKFTSADWNFGTWKARALALQNSVNGYTKDPLTGETANSATSAKLNLGTKSLQVYGIEKVEIYVDGNLFTGNLPVTITSPAQSGDVVEDLTPSDGGLITFTDLDLGQTHTPQVIAPLGAIGAITLGTLNEVTGSVSWTYTLDPLASQYLNAGEPKTETFVVTIDDGNGSIASQAITINILGTADIANTNLGTLKEEGVKPDYSPEPGVDQAMGQLVFNDVPSTATWSVDPLSLPAGASPTPVVGNTNYGHLSITAAGVWTFDLSNTSTATQLLDAGDVVTLTYTVAATYTDGTGPHTVFKNVVVTINGTNDVPTIVIGAQDTSVIEAGGVANTLNPDGGASGTLTLTDPDGTAIPDAVLIGTYGNLDYDGATGEWTYALRNGDGNVQALKGAIGANPADQVVDTLPMTVDGTTYEFKINITGADDKPTLLIKDTVTPFDQPDIAADLVGAARAPYYDFSVTEAGGAQNGTNTDALASGTVVMSDPDTSPLPPLKMLGNVVNPVTGYRFAADLSGETTEYGKFTLNTTSGDWGFTLRNNDANVQFLTPLDTITERLVIQDESGSVSREVRVTITGANDLVNQITNTIGSNGQTVSEAQDLYSVPPPAPPVLVLRNGIVADDVAGGVLNTIDPDAAPFNVPANGLGEKFLAPSVLAANLVQMSPSSYLVHGTYGDFTVDIISGVWSYDLKTQNELDTNGAAVDSDRDGNPDNDNTLNLNGAAAPDWTYSNVEALVKNQVATESFVIKSHDGGFSTTVSVQVAGHNDAADIFDITNVTPTSNLVYPGAAHTQGDYVVTEAGGLNNALVNDPNAGGKVASVDPDANQSGWNAASANPTVAGNYGTFTFTFATGAWTYALTNTNNDVQYLTAGLTLTDTLTLTAKDGTALFPHSAAAPAWTVTINGANDTAVITEQAGADKVAQEAGGTNNNIPGDAVGGYSASGVLLIDDIDGGPLPLGTSEDRFSTVVTQVAGADGSIGSFVLVNEYTGEWRYIVDESNANRAGTLNDGQSVTDSAIFYSADGSASQLVTVVVKGKTDVANLVQVLGDDETQAPGTQNNGAPFVPDAGLNANGQVVLAVGLTPTTFSTPSGTYAGTYGNFLWDAATGGWIYTLNADDAQTRGLAAGASATDTLSVTSTGGDNFTIVVDVFGANTEVTFPGQNNQDDPAGLNTPVVSPTGTVTYTVQDDGSTTNLQLRVQDVIGGVKIAVGTALVNDGSASTYTNPIVPPGGPAVMGELLVSDQVTNHDDQQLNVWIGQGTNGNDVLDATTDAGSATAVGGLFAGYDGDDFIRGTLVGTDYIAGGNNNDELYGLGGSDTILGGAGVDSIDGGTESDKLDGGDGNDEILGGAGDDTIDGGADNDTISGGADADTISGNGGADQIMGDAGADTIKGGEGNDTIDGGTQQDQIMGEGGDDDLTGGAGADTVNGGTGLDTLVGSAGNDSFDFRGLTFSNANSDVVVDFNNVVGDDDRILLTASQLPGYETFTNAQLHAGLTAAWFTTTTNIALEDYGTNARMVYDTTSGNLYFDPDGAASGVTFQLVADFTGSPAVPNINDFVFNA